MAGDAGDQLFGVDLAGAAGRARQHIVGKPGTSYRGDRVVLVVAGSFTPMLYPASA